MKMTIKCGNILSRMSLKKSLNASKPSVNSIPQSGGGECQNVWVGSQAARTIPLDGI